MTALILAVKLDAADSLHGHLRAIANTMRQVKPTPERVALARDYDRLALAIEYAVKWPDGEPCAYAADRRRLQPGEVMEPEHDHTICLEPAF